MAIKGRIVWNQAKIDNLLRAAHTAAVKTAYAVRTDVDDAHVVPRDVGTLQNTAYVETRLKDHVYLVYAMPYARRLYWHPEYNFRTSENANARGEWLQPWLTGDKKDFAKEAFRKLFIAQRKGVN